MVESVVDSVWEGKFEGTKLKLCKNMDLNGDFELDMCDFGWDKRQIVTGGHVFMLKKYDFVWPINGCTCR